MIKELTKSRDEALRERFEDICNSGVNSDYYDWKIVVALLMKQPAPRFYISAKKAEQYVLSFYRGAYRVKSSYRRDMVRDLVTNYEQVKQEHPRMRQFEIWEEVITRPAKSFYLSEKTIRHIVYEYLRPNRPLKRRT